MKVLLDTSVLCLSNTDYIAIINHLSEVGIAGGMTYEALILYTALKVDVDRIVTLNEKDFRGYTLTL